MISDPSIVMSVDRTACENLIVAVFTVQTFLYFLFLVTEWETTLTSWFALSIPSGLLYLELCRLIGVQFAHNLGTHGGCGRARTPSDLGLGMEEQATTEAEYDQLVEQRAATRTYAWFQLTLWVLALITVVFAHCTLPFALKTVTNRNNIYTWGMLVLFILGLAQTIMRFLTTASELRRMARIYDAIELTRLDRGEYEDRIQRMSQDDADDMLNALQG